MYSLTLIIFKDSEVRGRVLQLQALGGDPIFLCEGGSETTVRKSSNCRWFMYDVECRYRSRLLCYALSYYHRKPPSDFMCIGIIWHEHENSLEAKKKRMAFFRNIDHTLILKNNNTSQLLIQKYVFWFHKMMRYTSSFPNVQSHHMVQTCSKNIIFYSWDILYKKLYKL